MSLFSLAKDGKLPLHQHMDLETLDWIISNNPFEGSDFPSKVFSKKDISYLNSFIPKEEWFWKKDNISTIHGIRHLLRVGTYCIILSRSFTNFLPNLDNIMIAALLHDVRRTNDCGDEDHGRRSSEWFMKNLNYINEVFRLDLSSDDTKEIYFLINYHNIPYEKINNEPRYIEHRDSIDFLKTADALDRYRLPKKKWWFSSDKIKLTPPIDLMFFAYNLVIASERKYLLGLNNVESVLSLLN